MKAAVCHKFNEPLVLEDVDLRPPTGEEVEVAIGACAICHSDIHYIEGAWGGPLPAVYGHEAAGTVVETGGAVTKFRKGDRVLVTLIRSCRSCPSCLDGNPSSCEQPMPLSDGPLHLKDGRPLYQGLQTAAFAERVVVHESQIIRFPEALSMEAASLLSCGVITGVGAAINTAGVKPGSTVVVIGVGGVGLNVVQGAAIGGAARIIAVDISELKIRAAQEFGATHGVLATDPKPYRKAREINGGRGADYVFVAVGAVEAYDLAPRYLANGGKLIIVGMPPSGAKSRYEPVIIAALSQSFHGSAMGNTLLGRDIPYLTELHEQGRLKLEELISGVFPFEDINVAIRDTMAGQALRNVVVMQDSPS